MNIKYKTIQGVLWSGIQNWGSQAGSFLVFLILARLLTPSAFGLVALANIFIQFTQIFLDQGFSQALIQKKTINNQEINTIFWTQILIGILLSIITFVSAPLISQIFEKPSLESILKILSLSFIISSFSQTQKALLKRNFNFKAMATRSLVGILIAGIVGVIMAIIGYGVWSLVGQQLTYELIGVIVLWKASSWRPSFQFSGKYLASFYTFTLNLLGYKLLEFFNQRTDNLLIGYFLGETALGYYAIAQRILQVMTQLLVGTLNQVALSTFSRLQSDSQQFLKVFYQATQFTSLIAFPVFSAVIILSPELIVTLFGDQWSLSIPLLQILSIAGILRTISFFQRSAFIALGKPIIQLKLGLVNAIGNLIACLIAVQWGMIAVAIAYVISDYLVFPLGQWLLTKLISLSWKTYLSQFLAPIICSLMMSLGILITQTQLTPYLTPQISLMICSFLGIMVYTMSLWILFPKLLSQILDLRSLFKSSS